MLRIQVRRVHAGEDRRARGRTTRRRCVVAREKHPFVRQLVDVRRLDSSGAREAQRRAQVIGHHPDNVRLALIGLAHHFLLVVRFQSVVNACSSSAWRCSARCPRSSPPGRGTHGSPGGAGTRNRARATRSATGTAPGGGCRPWDPPEEQDQQHDQRAVGVLGLAEPGRDRQADRGRDRGWAGEPGGKHDDDPVEDQRAADIGQLRGADRPGGINRVVGAGDFGERADNRVAGDPVEGKDQGADDEKAEPAARRVSRRRSPAR